MTQALSTTQTTEGFATKAQRLFSAQVRHHLFAKMPVWLVLLPTLIVGFFAYAYLSDQYESVVHFVVRNQPVAPHAMQGEASLGPSANEPFAAPEDASAPYILQTWLTSPAALAQLTTAMPFEDSLQQRDVDIFHRYPLPWERPSAEALYRHYHDLVHVDVADDSHVITLRVRAFQPAVAQSQTRFLLRAAEVFANQLTARANEASATHAHARAQAAQARLSQTETALTAFRAQVGSPDVLQETALAGERVSTLKQTARQQAMAETRLAALAPQAPGRVGLDQARGALSQEVTRQQAQQTEGSEALAAHLVTYQHLLLDQQMAITDYAQAQAWAHYRQEIASSQALYLETLSGPSLPDEPDGPARLAFVACTFFMACCLVLCGQHVSRRVMEHAPEHAPEYMPEYEQ